MRNDHRPASQPQWELFPRTKSNKSTPPKGEMTFIPMTLRLGLLLLNKTHDIASCSQDRVNQPFIRAQGYAITIHTDTQLSTK